MPRLIGYWAVWWLVLWAIYGLFAAKFTWEETLAGGVLAALAALAVTVTRRAGGLDFRPHMGWLRLTGRLPGRVLADCGIVALALWRALVLRRPVHGAFRTVPFDAGGDDPESAARRALVIAGASLAPNTYVVAIDAEKGEMLVHQLFPSARPPGGGDREWPL